MNSKRCATCGRPRGLAQVRHSWSATATPIVPRTDDPTDTPWQITNDLIVTASIYRNGGTNDETHLCDDCLRIGLRHLKATIDELLADHDAGSDKDAEMASLTQRLGSTQHRLSNLAYDHDRMQERMKDLLSLVPTTERNSEAFRMAQWEANRGNAKGGA